MDTVIRRRDSRPDPSISVPTYTEFIRLGRETNCSPGRVAETEPESENKVIVFAVPPTYSEFIVSGPDPSTEKKRAASPLKISAPPTYSEFILRTHLDDRVGEELPTVEVPSYGDFLTAYTYVQPVSSSETVKVLDDLVAVPQTQPEKPVSEDLQTEQTTLTKTKTEKVGLTLSIIATALGWSSVALSVAASRYVEWYMFLPAVIALVFAITGERLNRRFKHQFYVNSIMFSVFAGVFPLILLAIGWLEL